MLINFFLINYFTGFRVFGIVIFFTLSKSLYMFSINILNFCTAYIVQEF